MASLAGCTEVEHGLYASDADLRLLAERGTYFDPQAGLVLQNYLDNKSHYLGIGNYTETAFETMQKVLPEFQELFRHAIATRGLKVIFGTDAVAGAHGRNAEEFLYRVQTCGQDPMAALRSEEHTSELQSRLHLVCRLLLEKKKIQQGTPCSIGILCVCCP